MGRGAWAAERIRCLRDLKSNLVLRHWSYSVNLRIATVILIAGPGEIPPGTFEFIRILLESLILAQNERWRHA